MFTQEEVERARRYHRPLYAVRLTELALAVAVPGVLAFGQAGRLVDGMSWWWLEVLVLSAVVLLAGTLAQLPLSLYRYRHERRWGFSTQSLRGWAGDRVKSVAVGLVLLSATLLGLIGAARVFPDSWPLVAGAGAAALVLLLSFVAPVVLEPIFNRFRPLPDERLAAELRGLAERAGVPVRDVLVADASRRTRKHNAYVSGLGRTRRVVLWDTLLERSGEPELKLVVAHELGHRRFRHVAWGTALGMAGAAASVAILWASLESESLLDAQGLSGADDPGVVPFAVFLFTALDLVATPLGAALSRRLERTADRFSLELTNDPEAYETTHVGLARENLSDLDPPRLYHLALHGHPTTPERVAAGRAWKLARR
jgi:Zn-dependent protease with chaperone function